MAKLTLNEDKSTLTIVIPIAFKHFGGRKHIIAPPGEGQWEPHRPRPDSAMIKALARAHRWKKLLESRTYATVGDLAKAENINASYICRVLRLTLLAPTIVEAILNGSQPIDLQLDDILKPFAVNWAEQVGQFGIDSVLARGTTAERPVCR